MTMFNLERMGLHIVKTQYLVINNVTLLHTINKQYCVVAVN